MRTPLEQAALDYARTQGWTPPQPSAQPLLFNGDLSTGDLSQWQVQCNPLSKVVVYDQASRGNRPAPPAGSKYAAAFTTVGNDPSGQNVRSQLQAPYAHLTGTEAFIGWQTWFPAGFPTIDGGKSDLFFMFAETFGPPWDGSPNAGLYVAADNHPDGNHLVMRDAGGAEEWTGPKLPTGRWIPFVVHKRFAQDASGFVELTADGKPQAFRDGRTRFQVPTQTKGEDRSFFTLNNYFRRGAFGSLTIYHAAAKVGTTYESVAPGS